MSEREMEVDEGLGMVERVGVSLEDLFGMLGWSVVVGVVFEASVEGKEVKI